MSNMLEQSIIDAKELKSAISKLAEEKTLERHAEDYQKIFEKMMSEEEDNLSPPLSDDDKMPDFDNEGSEMLDAGDEGGMFGGMPDLGPEEEDDISDDEQIIDLSSDFEDIPMSGDFSLEGDDEEEEIEINFEQLESEIATVRNKKNQQKTSKENVPVSFVEESPEEEEDYELNEDGFLNEKKPCWKGYEQVGMKTKNGKKVPNCVPIEEANDLFESEDFDVLDYDLEVGHGHQAQPSLNKGLTQDFLNVSKAKENVNKEEDEELKQKYFMKVRENKELNKKYDELLNITNLLKEHINTTNLLNAKLLHINRALRNDSLNERQKNLFKQKISEAKTVEEAKVIFETLNSAVGVVKQKKAPKSLREATVRKNNSLTQNSKEKPKPSIIEEQQTARWKKIAGITKT